MEKGLEREDGMALVADAVRNLPHGQSQLPLCSQNTDFVQENTFSILKKLF